MTAATARAASSAAVLSVNAGSSSLKFAVYPCADNGGIEAAGLSGLVEGLEPDGQPRLTIRAPGAEALVVALAPQAGEGPFEAALRAVVDAVERQGGHRLVAVAHRIVHGGARHAASVVIDDEVLAFLETLCPLAPLHQPHNLAGVRAFRCACPHLPQVACFDTAFHATTPDLEKRFALPESFNEQGVRRYGFHGLSYQYVSGLLAGVTPRARGRVLIAHLGNGASLCAVQDGRSIATSMGFSALDGLMMGSRCGALDAGVLLHLLRQGWTAEAIEELLYRKSGLRGVSGVSADMRTLRASSEPAAQRAVALFTYRLLRECGALAACLGGLDVLAFTGGIGEHDATLRRELCGRLAFLGLRLDDEANQRADGRAPAALHAADSRVELWVVPTDEGRVAARDALALIAARAEPDAVPAAAHEAA